MIGSMANYVQKGSMSKFVPMNANFGIVKPLEYRVKGGKSVKNEHIANRALEAIDNVIAEMKK
jgi:methylenetetrahydrofolate--tRNA-(uracil-5-)-methyltransferase